MFQPTVAVAPCTICAVCLARLRRHGSEKATSSHTSPPKGSSSPHHPYEDPAHLNTSPAIASKNLERIREEALHSYDRLPRPGLIQCSAGEDRSAPVAAYIHAKRAPKSWMDLQESRNHFGGTAGCA